jgi:hypothetical protein
MSAPHGELDQQKFGSIVGTNVLLLAFAPFVIAVAIANSFPYEKTVSDATVFGLPLLHAGDTFSVGIVAHEAIAIGLVSVGGLSFGLISIGAGIGIIQIGFGPGIIASGPCAFGVFAVGGAWCGLIAIGGASVGYVAIGGGACGVYVLAGGGKGRYVCDRRRQDVMAVEFLCRYVPRLRHAFAE